MEDLGDLCGLDYETAYYMKYGKRPPRIENKCTFAPPEIDWERVHEPDDYICWRDARIGDSIQALAY